MTEAIFGRIKILKLRRAAKALHFCLALGIFRQTQFCVRHVFLTYL